MYERKQKPAKYQHLIRPIETASIPKERLHTILGRILADGQPICITVTGSSMQPFLRHAEDRVFLAPISPSYNIKRGDILLYVRDGGSWVMHRVYRAKDGLLTMIGDGQWVLEPNIRKDQVIAKALYALRGGKNISFDRSLLNAVMKLYLCRMFAPGFFRKVFFKCVSFKSNVKNVVRLAARR